MAEVTALMSLDEVGKYNEWTKDQIYEAYVSEYNARIALNIEVNKLNRLIAEIKFKCTR